MVPGDPLGGDARADENVRGGSVEFGGVDPVRSHGRGHLLGERPAPLGEGGRGVVLGRGVRVIDGGMFEGDGGGGLAEERVGGDARQAEHRERGGVERSRVHTVGEQSARDAASERTSVVVVAERFRPRPSPPPRSCAPRATPRRTCARRDPTAAMRARPEAREGGDARDERRGGHATGRAARSDRRAVDGELLTGRPTCRE